MSRESTDEIRNGRVFNGFDYSLQVWVKNGTCQDCAHPRSMGSLTPKKIPCCNQRRYAGWEIANLSARLVDLRSVPNPR
ncbi:hypothetical protein LCGC14_2531060 [marine sediment metagenome]|uniref:Uncharacterized protein n=1 Tax=marine sediment metagenome TaxID=412755 RepID=A0A0F9DLR3_9ZZZZ